MSAVDEDNFDDLADYESEEEEVVKDDAKAVAKYALTVSDTVGDAC